MTPTTTTAYSMQQLGLPDDEALNETQLALIEPQRAALGFVPNMYRAMVNQPALLTSYIHGYQLFRTATDFGPIEQEVVFLAISSDNGCDYCTAAHSMVADKASGVPADVLSAIRAGATIADPRLAALYATATAVSAQRGHPDEATTQAFLKAGFTELDLLSVVLAVSVKVISNYTNHLFSTPVDAAFEQYAL